MHSTMDHETSRSRFESIDDEHREIILLIHEFDELLCRGGTKEQIIDLFAVVHSNIKSHFNAEEQLMRKHTYADYQAHKADHDRLLDQLDEIMTDYERGAHADRHLSLAKRITDWFAVHFAKMDAAMIDFEHRGHGEH